MARILLLLLIIGALVNCGGGGSKSSSDGNTGPDPVAGPPKSIAGLWQGTWDSRQTAAGGTWCAEFEQSSDLLSGKLYIKGTLSGPSITGTIRMPGGDRLPLPGASVYIAGGNSIPPLGQPLAGSLTADRILFGEKTGSGFQFIGSLLGNTTALGTYINQTVQDQGDWSAVKSDNAGSSCMTCDQPEEPYLDFVCSDVTGNFRLNLPSSFYNSVLVKVETGVCSAEVVVPVTSSEINIGEIECKLRTDLAVVTGAFDRMEDLLGKLGGGALDTQGRLVLGTEMFDLYDGVNDSRYNNSLPGAYPDFPGLFSDGNNDGKADIFMYNVIFINCGNTFESTFLLNSAYKQMLRDYVFTGGNIYVTDLSYDFIEQVFPEYIDFYGSNETPVSAPEAHNAAETGTGAVSTNAAVVNAQLGQWLGQVPCGGSTTCLNSDGTVRIDSFGSEWAVINNVRPEVTVFIEAGAEPLTVSFRYGAGKVVFSSYHTEETGGGVSPQERILQYLMFML